MSRRRGPVVALRGPLAAGVIHGEIHDSALTVEMEGVAHLARVLDAVVPERIAQGWRLIDDCEVRDGRITRVGPTAARVRDAGIVLLDCLPANALRPLFDAGFRVTLEPDEFDLAADLHGFDDVELAACAERAAVGAFLPDAARDDLVARVRAGWDVHPPRLLHLAARDRWEASRAQGSYLPEEWDRDGFIHLSAPHQLLTPANRFYRGREDLVVVELDAHFLGDAVVWEAGTDTLERFPHLYAAITPEAVVREFPIVPSPDGSFLLS